MDVLTVGVKNCYENIRMMIETALIGIFSHPVARATGLDGNS